MHRAAKAVAALAALGALAVLTAACPGRGDPVVPLTGAWPERPDDYDDVVDRWTRSEGVRADMDEHLSEIFAVRATLLSPEWRAAYVEERAEREELSPARRQALQTAQRERHESHYEVMLIARAYERRLLDFHHGEDSVWTVILADGEGNEIEASEIVRDRRLPSVIGVFFPFIGDFDEAFVARFPRAIELFGEGADRVELLLASPRATVRLAWEGA